MSEEDGNSELREMKNLIISQKSISNEHVRRTASGRVESSVIMCNLPKYHVTANNENNNHSFVTSSQELSIMKLNSFVTQALSESNVKCYVRFLLCKNQSFSPCSRSVKW